MVNSPIFPIIFAYIFEIMLLGTSELVIICGLVF